MSDKKIHTPDAFYSLYAISRMMKIPKATVDKFDREHPPSELSPIAHLFVCFEEEGRVTWAIRKKYFDRWRKTGIPPKKNSGRPRKHEKGVKHINIPAPYFYDAFIAGVKKCNKNSIQQITIQDFIYVAMLEAMKRRPDIFGVDIDGK